VRRADCRQPRKGSWIGSWITGSGPGKERESIFNEIRATDPHWAEPTKLTAGERTIQANAESALQQAEELKKTLEANKEYVGPVAGLAKYWPGSKAQVIDADVKLAKQRIGKVLEGGVLRKEDEKKYKDMLADLTNNPATAIGKMDNILKTLGRDIQIAKDIRAKAGRTPQAVDTPTAKTPAPAAQPAGVVAGGEKKVGDVRINNKDGNYYRIMSLNPLRVEQVAKP
jgi:hypothetical protein